MRCLIIGYGSIGKRHGDILKNMFGADVDVVSKRSGKYKHLNEVDLNKYDYFIISNETEKHFETLKYIDQNINNKIILVEKPLFERFYSYIPKNKVYVGYNLRYHPVIRFLKNNIKNPVFVDIKCGQYLPEWRKRDYRKIYSSFKTGGGVLRDLSHELDYMCWIFGEIDKFDYISDKISNLEIESDDIFCGIGYTEKGVVFNITLDYISKIPYRNIIIHTDKETVIADLISSKIRINEKVELFENIQRDYTYYLMHKDILNKAENACSFEEGINVVKLIDKVLK